MKNRFRISIRTFIWLSSLTLLLVFVFILFDSLQNVRDISKKASAVRLNNLPSIIESQRSFVNIEGLRRLAEVAYVSEDPRKRREARISARALAIESVFDAGSEFNDKVVNMAKLISELAGKRDDSHNNRLRLQELSREYLKNVLYIAAHVKDDPNVVVILQTYYNSFLSSVDVTTVSHFSNDDFLELQRKDANVQTQIRSHCANITAHYNEMAPYCDKLNIIYPEYADTFRQFNENLNKAHAQWVVVDGVLREMLDAVSNDSELITANALSSIEETASTAATGMLAMLVAGTLFILAFIFAQNWLIAKPILWVGKKLLDIQKGNVDSTIPNIRITELYHVADLLDRFSEHLMDLTSHASLLAEDAAEKKELEALMGAIFQLNVDGYIIWSPNGQTRANRELLSLLGLRDMDELHEKWDSLGLITGEDRDALYKKVLENGFDRHETYLQNTRGEQIPFEVACLPMKRQGEDYLFSYFRDLSEQKRTEVVLREARNAAEKAAQVKSEFLARMSHEIRTPMNGVIGLTNLALAANPPAGQREYLRKIQSSARILLGVINDILDFSKLESGRLQLEKRTFSFPRLLHTTRDLFEVQASAKGLEFIIETSPDIPTYLKGDELRLSQILLNLCGNAIKFTERGGVTLRVSLLADHPDTVNLCFAVIDSGVGISEQQAAGLFQAFTQADTSTTRKYGGTGLGLVISKLLVEMMQGTIKVKSTPGLGSSFSFDAVLEKATEELDIDDPLDLIHQDLHVLEGKHALLAEDNEINQEIAVALLEALGIKATVADNGQQALEMIELNAFDVVLMDIQMPVMDGLTATRKIREHSNDAIRNIPIVAMTAHAMKEDREKSMDAGMSGHITKPIDQRELGQILCQVLS
jgi:Signal transduction histidine kinase